MTACPLFPGKIPNPKSSLGQGSHIHGKAVRVQGRTVRTPSPGPTNNGGSIRLPLQVGKAAGGVCFSYSGLSSGTALSASDPSRLFPLPSFWASYSSYFVMQSNSVPFAWGSPSGLGPQHLLFPTKITYFPTKITHQGIFPKERTPDLQGRRECLSFLKIALLFFLL